MKQGDYYPVLEMKHLDSACLHLQGKRADPVPKGIGLNLVGLAEKPLPETIMRQQCLQTFFFFFCQ